MERDRWTPTGDELASILDEMRPVVAAFARRDADRLAAWATEATAARPVRRCRRRSRAFIAVPAA